MDVALYNWRVAGEEEVLRQTTTLSRICRRRMTLRCISSSLDSRRSLTNSVLIQQRWKGAVRVSSAHHTPGSERWLGAEDGHGPEQTVMSQGLICTAVFAGAWVYILIGCAGCATPVLEMGMAPCLPAQEPKTGGTVLQPLKHFDPLFDAAAVQGYQPARLPR